MKNKTLLVSSILTIIGATSLSIGATYSLFTSTSIHDISVTSGKIDVTASVDKNSIRHFSNGVDTKKDSFENGGKAELINGGTFKLININPLDSIKFKINIKNDSTIAVKYKVSISKEDNLLGNALVFNGPTLDTWTPLNPKGETSSEGIFTEDYTISFPNGGDSDNDLKNKETIVHINVEAIQANAPIAQNYTIDFNSEFGGPFEQLSYQPGQTIKMPLKPTNENYNFEGWFKDNETFKDEFVLTKMPMENLTLFAKWSPKPYKITLNTLGGNSINSIEAKYNEPIKAPIDPYKKVNGEYKEFEGWYLEDNFQTKYDFPSKMPGKNLTLYAKYNETHDFERFTYETDDYSSNKITGLTSNKYSTIIVCVENSNYGAGFGEIAPNSFSGHDEVKRVIIYGSTFLFNKDLLAGTSIEEFIIDGAYSDSILTDKPFKGYNSVIKINEIPFVESKIDYSWTKDLGENARVLVGEDNFNDNNSYTIEAVDNYNGIDKSFIQTGVHGTRFNLPEEIIEGYTFKGWFLDQEFKTPYTKHFIPQGGAKIYAKRIPNA